MITSISRKTQTAVCMILSAVIVSVGLSLGAFAAEHAAHHDGYSVDDHADSVSSPRPLPASSFKTRRQAFGPSQLIQSHEVAETQPSLREHVLRLRVSSAARRRRAAD
jgi:hypothetical protein